MSIRKFKEAKSLILRHLSEQELADLRTLIDEKLKGHSIVSGETVTELKARVAHLEQGVPAIPLENGRMLIRIGDLPEYQQHVRKTETIVAIALLYQMLIPLHALWFSAESAAKAGRGERLRTTLQEMMGPMATQHATVIKHMADCGFPRDDIGMIELITGRHLQGIQNVLDNTDKGEMLREIADQEGAKLTDALIEIIEGQRGGAPKGPRPSQKFILLSVLDIWRSSPDGRQRNLGDSALYFVGQLFEKYQNKTITDDEHKALEILKGRDVVEYVSNLRHDHREWLKDQNLVGSENQFSPLQQSAGLA